MAFIAANGLQEIQEYAFPLLPRHSRVTGCRQERGRCWETPERHGSDTEPRRQYVVSGSDQTHDTGPRKRSIEWNSHESKVLLENYVRYVPQVGPDKKFRSKKEMFKRIADHIFEATGQRRTGEQCENRYKTIMRRKRRHGEGRSTGLARARILLHTAAGAEDGEDEQFIEEEEPEVEEEEAEPKQEELQQQELEDDEPELLAELAAMGDEEQQINRRASRKRKSSSAIDQQLLLDQLHELHEQRERRRDERERRRELRHAEQMNLLRRILSVLERQPLTASTANRLRVAATHR
ncbi:uncharacterized protein LOC142580063 isoform X1 [Dermacentor variabilis]|uniref:uncharacterized protein LOC142580063 isoform X1 n=1 Tax=Dermacentor variabilis TaxID=34621 RepID=UPI003F5C62B4